MDNFDLKKYLVENRVTTNSRMLSENEVSINTAGDKLEAMGFNEDLLAYVVEDGKVSTINGQDKMIFDHYMDYLADLVGQHGGIMQVSRHRGPVPTVSGIKPNIQASITFDDGKTLIIAQDNTSEIPEFDDEGNLAGDQSSENIMDVSKLGDKFFTLSNQVDLIHTEKWLESKNIPASKKKAAANAETFTKFEKILRADFPLISTFETGDDYVETVYVYDLGDGNVVMVDDYVDGFSIHPKAAFEKFKEDLKQTVGKA
jgi:hypothetical protein